VKLLRVLQEKKFSKVGDLGKEIAVDVRIISATNKDLWQLMNDGLFREDLFFRITNDIIQLPPLRDRGTDVVEIAEIILEKLNTEYNDKRSFTPDAISKLKNYCWPGNIRELGQVIGRAFIYADKKIQPDDIRFMINPHKESKIAELNSEGVNLKQILENIELEYIKKALVMTDGNQTKAEILLGLGKKAIQNRIDNNPELRDIAKTRKK